MMQIITPAERLAERHGVHALKTSEPLQPQRKYHDAELSRRWRSFLMVFPGSSRASSNALQRFYLVRLARGY